MSQSTLKMVSGEYIDEMMLSQPIKISDAASMMRKKIHNNDKPYTKALYQCNNNVVDEWYNKVLLKVGKGGNIQVGRVQGCLSYFLEGRGIKAYEKYKDLIPSPSEELVSDWINLFRKLSVSDLYEMGPFVVSSGWSIVHNAITLHFMKRKRDEVYSKSEDPADWDKLANDNPHVMNHRPLPYGLDEDALSDIRDKVLTVLKEPVPTPSTHQ